jgi:hypothetical protein
VETDEFLAAYRGWRASPVAELVWAAEEGIPFPEAYRGWRAVVVAVADAVILIGTGEFFGSITGYAEESYELTLLVAELCEQHGVTPPAFAPFARLPFTGKEGWGRKVPQSFDTPV